MLGESESESESECESESKAVAVGRCDGCKDGLTVVSLFIIPG